jgi:hypothetical protein
MWHIWNRYLERQYEIKITFTKKLRADQIRGMLATIQPRNVCRFVSYLTT